MAKFDVYAVEVSRFGPVGVAIVAAYMNAGGYPRAESYLLIPDEKTIYSQGMSFNVKTFKDSPVELTEDFMLDEALHQVKIDLGQYFDGIDMQPPEGFPNLSKENINLLVHSWIRGTCPHIIEIGRRTELQELREAIIPIVQLPVISKSKL